MGRTGWVVWQLSRIEQLVWVTSAVRSKKTRDPHVSRTTQVGSILSSGPALEPEICTANPRADLDREQRITGWEGYFLLVWHAPVGRWITC